MTRAAVALSFVIVLPFAVTHTPLAARGPQGTFRSSIDLVSLTVTVTDAADKYIKGLSGNDFVVTEDGVPQLLSFFAADPVPLDLAIVLDTSGSMGADIRIVQQAATGLARSLGPRDRAAVVEIKLAAQFTQMFTGDLASIQSAIYRVQPGGDTGLYNGLYVLLREFARQRRESREIRRQAMVILSDGGDNASHIEFDEVLDLARRVGVSTYVISPKPRMGFGMTAREHQLISKGHFTMNALVREAGGLVFSPEKITDLHRIYGAIASELANQYELGYVPAPAGDGRFRRVAVQVISRDDARVRTRSGYFAQAATGPVPD
jgi:Ca-activated chloride channel family protein